MRHRFLVGRLAGARTFVALYSAGAIRYAAPGPAMGEPADHRAAAWAGVIRGPV
jgi:hypothetical protein